MSTSVAFTFVIHARYVCQPPGFDTGTMVLSQPPSYVLNQLRASPLYSRMSLSGGQLLAPVSQNAGQVPRADGAWKSPLTSHSGNWSLTVTRSFEWIAPEW